MRDVLNVAGIVLQVFGGLITLVGINNTMLDLVPRSDGLPIVGYVVKRWRNRGASHQTWHGSVGHISVIEDDDFASAYASVMPPETADVQTKVEYLDRRVTAVETRIPKEAQIAREEVFKLSERVSLLDGSLQGQIDKARQEAKEYITGPNGKGLRLAAIGVTITTVGSFLTIFLAVMFKL